MLSKKAMKVIQISCVAFPRKSTFFVAFKTGRGELNLAKKNEKTSFTAATIGYLIEILFF